MTRDLSSAGYQGRNEGEGKEVVTFRGQALTERQPRCYILWQANLLTGKGIELLEEA
jgi:hypothetical protein